MVALNDDGIIDLRLYKAPLYGARERIAERHARLRSRRGRLGLRAERAGAGGIARTGGAANLDGDRQGVLQR